jgi:AcrR family transcriptional regulator
MATAANKLNLKAAPRRSAEPASRRQPRQSRAQETVDALLTATKTLLIRGGVEAATTNAVAKLAGVSIGSLYQYFPSREALIFELSRRHVADVLGLIYGEIGALLGTSIHVGVRRLIKLMIDVHRKDPELHAAIEASHPGLGARAQLMQMDDQVMSMARAYLEQHRAELVVSDLDRASFVVVTTIEALTHDACLKRPDLLENDTMVEDMSRLILGYLAGT